MDIYIEPVTFAPLILTVYAYLIGSILFTPVVPGPLVLLIYVLVIEAITFLSYYLLGWKWNPLIRIMIVGVTLIGYFLSAGVYEATKAIHKNSNDAALGQSP